MKKIDFIKYLKENQSIPNPDVVNQTKDSVDKLTQSMETLKKTMETMEENEVDEEIEMSEEIEITESKFNPLVFQILAEAENPKISKKELMEFVLNKKNG